LILRRRDEEGLSALGPPSQMVRMNVADVVQPDVMFQSLDVDDSGVISLEEILLLGNVVDAPFVLWSPDQFREAAGAAACATSFTKPEFLKWYSAVQPVWQVEADELTTLIAGGHAAREIADPFNHEIIELAFKAIDIDDSGEIDFDELMHFSTETNIGWTESFCKTLLGKMDADGNSSISFDEFETFIGQVGLHGVRSAVDAFIAKGEERRAAVEDDISGRQGEDAAVAIS